MTLTLIWAQSPSGVIGRDNTLPWRVPEDQARFRRLTDGHVVVMGRATWESLPDRWRPLPGRDNVVLSRTPGYRAPGAVVVPGLDEALAHWGPRDVWVVGGQAVYTLALPRADRVERTVVDLEVEGDTWAPDLDEEQWTLVDRVPGTGWSRSTTDVGYRFETFDRRP